LSDRNFALLLALLSLISVLPLFTTLNYPFQFDDYPTIFEDPNVDGIDDLFHIKLSERPIRKISIIFDRILFKSNVALYRLENILLYMITVFLTSMLLYRLTKERIFAVFSVFLFSFHPVHMENILIITHRKELFLYIFSMLSFFTHIEKKRILSLLFFFLALFSKEVAIVLPLIYLFYDLIFEGRADKRLYMAYGGIFLAGVVAVTLLSRLTGFYIPSPADIREYFSINRMLRDADYLDIVKIQPLLFIGYLKNLILPFNLNVDYYVPVTENINLIWVFSLILSTAYFAGLWLTRKNKIILFFMIFFAVAYVPLSNFIPVLNLFADRYLFLPSFALMLFFFFIYTALKKYRYALLIVAVYYLIISIAYMPVFRSEKSLWNYVVSKNPKSVVGNNNLGLYLMQGGDLINAEKYLLQAVQVDSMYGNAYVNLGTLYAQKRDYKQALYYLEKARSAEPDNVKGLYNLGLTYMNLGMAQKAQDIMKEIVKISPESSLAMNNLGASHFEEGMLYESSAKLLYSGMCYGLFPYFINNAVESYVTAKGYFEEGTGIDPSYDKLKQNLERINKKISGE